jgi:hypothetical protein
MGSYFTKAEAEARVGNRIRTVRAWASVPVGTCGFVTEAHRVQPASAARELYDVEIHLYRANPGGPSARRRHKRATFHHVRRDEYEAFLTEETEEI